MTLSEFAISILGAFVAAAAGALAVLWYQRGRPWIGLKSIRRDDRDLVTVPPELRALVTDQRWAGALFNDKAPLYKLVNYAQSVEGGIASCKSTLEKAETLQARLQSGIQGVSDQKRFIDEMLSDYFLPQVLTNMTVSGRLPLPETVENGEALSIIVRVDDLTAPDLPEKALIIYGDQKRHSIKAGEGLLGPETLRRTRVLGQVFQFFMAPQLLLITKAIREELRGDYQSLLEIRERLSGVIRSQRLVLRAQIVNTGVTPIHIDPFALLKIRSSGIPVSPVIAAVQSYRLFEPGLEDFSRVIGLMEGLAEKQGVETGKTPHGFHEGPEFVVVSGGQLVEVELATITPIDDDAVVRALEAGMLSCQLVMKRVAHRWRPWLNSKELVMGLSLSPDKSAELMTQA